MSQKGLLCWTLDIVARSVSQKCIAAVLDIDVVVVMVVVVEVVIAWLRMVLRNYNGVCVCVCVWRWWWQRWVKFALFTALISLLPPHN